MDFETFKMAIDAIQKHREQQEKVTNFIESEICTESWAFCTFGDNLSDALLKVLEHVFNDKGEWISWWLYEDVEKEWVIDGELIKVKTPEQFYDALKKLNRV